MSDYDIRKAMDRTDDAFAALQLGEQVLDQFSLAVEFFAIPGLQLPAQHDAKQHAKAEQQQSTRDDVQQRQARRQRQSPLRAGAIDRLAGQDRSSRT
jgi:hypothetical protein